MFVPVENCVLNYWNAIYLLLMNEIVNDVIIVMIGIFGKYLK